jgi:hypothetical protein
MVRRPAPRALRGYVRNYTGYEEWSAEPLCRREVPSADVTLILSPDSELRVPERHTSFVAALHDRCALVEYLASRLPDGGGVKSVQDARSAAA